jgi:hypothetical protein
VEVADEPGDAAEAVVGVEQGEVVWPGDGAGDEGEDFAAVLVEAQWARRAVETRRVQVAEQGVHRRGPRARMAAHGIADPHHTAADVASVQRDLGHGGLPLGDVCRGQARLIGPMAVQLAARRDTVLVVPLLSTWGYDRCDPMSKAGSSVSTTTDVITAAGTVVSTLFTGYIVWDVRDRRRSSRTQAADGVQTNRAAAQPPGLPPHSSTIGPEKRERSLRASFAPALALWGFTLSGLARKFVGG